MRSDETLLAWWLDELDEDEALEVEAHLFECDECGARLRELLRLRAGVRDALKGGHAAAAVSAEFIGRLREDGLRVREYRLEAGGSVACTVAPEDDLVVSLLRAPLAGIRQLDMEFEREGETHRASHIPFDAGANEVAVIIPTAELKKMGVFQQRTRLYAVTLDSERLVGEYTFNHSPWGAR
jgi:anti-sigma factor RsiW